MGSEDSDSDSSLSDYGRPQKAIPKKRPATTTFELPSSSDEDDEAFKFSSHSFRKRKESTVEHSNGHSSGSDSDSDQSLNLIGRKKKFEVAEKSDDDSDSDDDMKGKNASANQLAKLASKNGTDTTTVDLPDSDDDSDVEKNNVTSINITMSEALQKAKKARIALFELEQKSMDISVDDDDDNDVIVPRPPNTQLWTRYSTSATATTSANVPTEPKNSDTVQWITVTTRIKGGDPEKTHIYRLKACDPFSKLSKAYRKHHGYSSIKRVIFEMNDTVLDLDKCPNDMGITGKCDIFIEDEEQRLKQVNRMTRPAGNDASAVIGVQSGGISLKVRINGSDKSTHLFAILPRDSFKKLIHLVCQKYKVDHSDCKFVFDGDQLNPGGTPEDEDLEGGEVIDVEIDKNALARGLEQNGGSAPAQPQEMNNTSHASGANESTASTAKVIIAIYVIRNNTGSKPKKFRLYSTDKLSKLKEGYKKHFSNKGCRSVKFYLRGALIANENVTLSLLNITETDRLVAMENGKTFR